MKEQVTFTSAAIQNTLYIILITFPKKRVDIYFLRRFQYLLLEKTTLSILVERNKWFCVLLFKR